MAGLVFVERRGDNGVFLACASVMESSRFSYGVQRGSDEAACSAGSIYGADRLYCCSSSALTIITVGSSSLSLEICA